MIIDLYSGVNATFVLIDSCKINDD